MKDREKGFSFLLIILASYVFVVLIMKYFPYANANLENLQGQQLTAGEVVSGQPAAQASGVQDVDMGETGSVFVTLSGQQFTVAATNSLYPVFGLNPARTYTFNDSANIAANAAGLYSISSIDVRYDRGEPAYVVHGLAKDRYGNYDVDNARTVVVQAQSGHVVSVQSEPLLVSFLKRILFDTFALWTK